MLEQTVSEPAVKGKAIVEVMVEPCLHDRRRIIGMDDTAYYYSCDRCRETLAEMGGIVWHVRPALIPP